MTENGSNRLLAFVLAIEAQDDVKREAGVAQRQTMTHAKKAGFDPAMIRQMVAERKLDVTVREEKLATAQIYRGALGMLGDTPLGEAAQRRLLGDDAPAPGAPGGDQAEPGKGKKAKPAPVANGADLEKAQAAGAAAARAGEKVTSNPYRHGDACRVSWDHGWCSASASDGMDIPAAFRRPKKPDDTGAEATT